MMDRKLRPVSPKEGTIIILVEMTVFRTAAWTPSADEGDEKMELRLSFCSSSTSSRVRAAMRLNKSLSLLSVVELRTFVNVEDMVGELGLPRVGERWEDLKGDRGVESDIDGNFLCLTLPFAMCINAHVKAADLPGPRAE